MPLEQINVTLGTAGHIDHGKTTLVKNLTGCDTDRLKEEKERGMSIELGFAPCRISELQVGIVDVPGHENFIKTMVAGATGIDGVILVVAADDGIMPQTVEHLEILTLLGVRYGLVALTKIDRVAPDRVQAVIADLQRFLAGTFLEAATVVPVSNTTAEGFDVLAQALADLVQSIQPRPTDGVFRMPVERTFSVKGYGTVVTGIPVSGLAKLEDELVLLPNGTTGRLKAIQVYKKNADQVKAGQCTALNVRQFEHDAITRGCVVAAPGYFQPAEWFLVKLKLLNHEKIFVKHGMDVRFHTGTSESAARAYLLTDAPAGPGFEGFVQIHTAEPVVAGPNDRFILRTLSPVRTIGGGGIVEPLAQRLRRNHPETFPNLEEWGRAVFDKNEFVEFGVRHGSVLPIREAEITGRTKIPAAQVRQILRRLADEKKIIAAGPDAWLHAQFTLNESLRIINALKEFHQSRPESPGPAFDQLVELAGLEKNILDFLLKGLKAQSKVVEQNGRFALPEHRHTVPDQDRELFDRIDRLFQDRPFNPPDLHELPALTGSPDARIQRVIRLLIEQDRLVQAPEGLLFHRQAVERAKALLVDHLRKEGRLESVKFKYLLDTTRKYALPLLDYFDRVGLTSRINNTRYLKNIQSR